MRRRGGFEHRGETNVKRLVLVAGGIVVLLVAWILLVTSIGGANSQEQGASQGGGDSQGRNASNEAPDQSPAGPTPEAPLTVEGSVQTSGGDEEPHYITPDNPRQAEREKYEDNLPEGGVSQEPGSYDPLGVEPKPGQLSQRDAERAELAASKFVTAAYGYTGEDKNKYNQGVGATIIWPGFYDSPAAARITDYASEVEDSGTKSAAKVTEFEKKSVSGKFGKEKIKAVITFSTADTYNRYGEIEGTKKSYRQEMALKRDGAVFKVAGAEKIEEVGG